MAIEFDCPYCTATIRVPDAYGGKQGRCPKCDTKMLVPTVTRPVAEPTGTPIAATEPAGVQSIVESLPATEEFQVRPNVGAGTTTRRRPTRRRTSRTLVIGIPVLLLLVILGIVGYTLTNLLPELTGELFARKVQDPSLPRAKIKWSDTGLTSDEQDVLREYLRIKPETFNSQVMTCQFIGADDGIEVQLTAGPGYDWFVVDTTTSKPLAIWLKKERPRLNSVRLEIMQESLQTYCRDKIAQINGGKALMDATAVRDNVGLNATGGVLSFVVHAINGKMAVPCSSEDDKGMIYFCLPGGTLAFQIQGRTLPDKSKPFAGEFSAIVVPAQSTAADTQSEVKPAEDSPGDGIPSAGTAEPDAENLTPTPDPPTDASSNM